MAIGRQFPTCDKSPDLGSIENSVCCQLGSKFPVAKPGIQLPFSMATKGELQAGLDEDGMIVYRIFPSIIFNATGGK